MSEAELPEDPQKWPRDPYALLGVRPQDDLVTIRKAYTRLIRRYKPEHFPEQFIRLRTAYEQITSDRTAVRAEVEFDLTQPIRTTELTHDASHQQDSQRTIDPKSFNNLDEVWNLAARGLYDEALALLANHAWHPSELISAKLTEYWITKLRFPSAEDPQAIGILLAHLHLFRHLPRVMEIVQDELHFHASLVDQIDLAKCLEGLIDVDDVLDIVHLRWAAALRASQFTLIANDWKLLDRMYRGEYQLRAAMAFAWLDYLGWSDSPEHHDLVESASRDLKADVRVSSSNADEFERLEMMRSLADELRSFEAKCAQWKDISRWVPFMWNDVTAGFSAGLCSWLLQAIQAPRDALQFFDDLQPYPYLRKFCVRRLQLLIHEANEFAEPALGGDYSAHLHDWKVREPTEMDSELIEEFLSGYNNQTYEQFRIELARFSIEKNIMPPKICGYIEERESVVASFFFYRFFKRIKSDSGLASLTQVFCNRLF